MISAKVHLKGLYRTDTKQREGYLRLDMNESVSGMPDRFVKNILSRVDSNFVAMYPEYNRLLNKVASHNGLSPANICLSNGSDAAIKYIFDAYVAPGDKVLLTDPTFAMYPIYCRIFNAKPVFVPYNHDLSFPVEAYLRKISRGIKLAVIVNPNNPTGSVIDKNTIRKIIRKAAANNVLVLVDEAYFYFYPETIIAEIKNFKNLIVSRSFSKLCGLASGRVGYAAADKDIIENLKRVKPTYDVNAFGVLFAEAILDDPRVINSLIKKTNEGKRFILNKLVKSGIEYSKGNANFVLIKCYERSDTIMRKLSAKKILVGGGFKQPFLKDYIRITVGDRKQMKAFWDVFVKIYKSKA